MGDGRIVAYGCESSGYPALVSALAAEANAALARRVDVVRLPCSGRIEVGLLLGALERGARGALVLGCARDACKYVTGNLRAEKRAGRARRALRDAGIPEDRIRIELLSSLDSHKAVQALGELDRQLTAGQRGGNQA